MEIKVHGETYSLPDDLTFTYRELGLIKRVSGVRALELADAFQAGDTDLFVALAVIAARRSGVDLDPEALEDAEVGTIEFVGAEDDAGPPDQPSAGEQTPNPGASDVSSAESTASA